MNNEASVDEVLKAMGKQAEVPTIKFSSEECDNTSLDILQMKHKRIYTLMGRKSLTQLDINLLEVLLKSTKH